MSVVDLFHRIARNDFGFFQQIRSAADVMTAQPPTLTLDDTLESAAEIFRRLQVDHAPVISPEDNAITGIVSQRDLARSFPRLLGTAAEQEDDHKALQVGIPRIMTRNPICCPKEASVIDVITLMLKHHIDSVVISPDGRTLDGLITVDSFLRTLSLYHRVCTRDVRLRRLRLVDMDLQNGLPLDEVFATGAQTVRDVMSGNVHTIRHDDHLSAAMDIMQEYEIRHLPVLNADSQVTGILSDTDILRFLPVPDRTAEESETRFREKLFATDDKSVLRERIDNVMNTQVGCVPPEMLLTEALNVFSDRGIAGLPVADPSTGKLCGILTKFDVLRVFRVVVQIGVWTEAASEQAAAAQTTR